jgi:gliding motility-associated-like protein
MQCSISWAYGLNVAITESSQSTFGYNMDNQWREVVSGMGHTPFVYSQSILDDDSFFSNTDVLIISSGSTNLPPNRVETILQFIQSGKSVYLQSEHLSSYSTNIAFKTIVTSLGGFFLWNNSFFSDNLGPMDVVGTFSTTNNVITSLDYYWYSVSGIGDCNTISYLRKDGEYHGFQYVPTNPLFGSIITSSDQDWINSSSSSSHQLMENIITHLISPPPVSFDLTLNLGSDTALCQGEEIILDATTPTATYLWQDNSTNPTFNVTQQGTYWVEVIVNNCSVSDTINVSYSPLPAFSLGSDTVLCEGEMLIFDVTISDVTYLWQDNSTNATFDITKEGTYWVGVTNNCQTIYDTINVDFYPVLSIDLGNDTIICQEELLILDAVTPGATYFWQDSSFNSTVNATQQGLYWVVVRVNNCIVTDTVLIKNKDCEIILKIPNVFTPNNDGLNDFFIPIISKGISSMKTIVFNRWGQLIFNSNLLEINWNGKTSNGSQVPNGTYFWIVDYTDINGVENNLKGYVTILK